MISLIEIYYFTQIFLIGYYSNVNIFLLIIKSFLIYISSKNQHNIILDCINENINELMIFPWLSLSYTICFIEYINQFHLYFVTNFILTVYINAFYNVFLCKQNMEKIIYLTLCMVLML